MFKLVYFVDLRENFKYSLSVFTSVFKMPVHRSKEVKIFIYQVYKYFEDIVHGKAENFSSKETKTQLVHRLNVITGISNSSLFDIIRTGESSGDDIENAFKRSQREFIAKKTGLSDEQMGSIRSVLYNFHLTEQRVATIKGLCEKVVIETGLQLSRSSMRKVIRKLGFRFNKTKNNRMQLVEKADIKEKRRIYLEKISHFRSIGRPIVFTDETYVHSYYSTFKAWQDESIEGFKPKIGKGKRFIIVHAGSEAGFVDNAFLCFRSYSNQEDYHGDMNNLNFTKWATEKLIPNLPPESIIVMDNAPYHNSLKDKPPNTNSKKGEILAWLTDKVC